jgi:hypothetical protein
LLSVRKGEHKLVINFAEGRDQLFEIDSHCKKGSPLPVEAASGVRKQMLAYAKKHVVESRRSRDLDLRFGSRIRELRTEWMQANERPN